jgi:hypothetical protein
MDGMKLMAVLIKCLLYERFLPEQWVQLRAR